MTSTSPEPSLLLAAYAAGGLSTTEQLRVEAYLAENAGARAELAELRALVDATRDAAGLPASEPAWDDMARSIRLAVDDMQRPWWTRTFTWLRARPRLVSRGTLVALSVAGGVALYGALTGPGDRPTQAIAVDERRPEATPDFDIELPGLEQAWDADSIVYELDPEEAFEGMFAAAATVEGDDDTDPALDFRIAPELDTLLDALTEEELEAIEAHLEGTPS